jgi:hypothetical protein
VAFVLIGLRGLGLCERLPPSTLLPEEVARTLDLGTGGGPTGASWEAEQEACVRQFGEPGQFEPLVFEEPRARG